jgi:hypothetical protein
MEYGKLEDVTGAGSGGADPGNGAHVGARPGWIYDVALSFASAQRDYVEQVAAALQAGGVRCFYDADEQIDLWGKYLAEELPTVYGEQAAAVVVFVSADYAARDWTRHERRAAMNRAVTERREYVLPARFDNTSLPGLLADMVAIDLRTKTPQQFADVIVAKLTTLNVLAVAAPTIPEGGPSAPTTRKSADFPDAGGSPHWNAEVVTASWIDKLGTRAGTSPRQLQALGNLKKFSKGYGKANAWTVRLSLSEEHVLYLAHEGKGKSYRQVVWLDETEVYRGEPRFFHQFKVKDGYQSRTLRVIGLKRKIELVRFVVKPSIITTWSIEVDGRELIKFIGWTSGILGSG